MESRITEICTVGKHKKGEIKMEQDKVVSKLGQALSWWKYLTEDEQEILITLLYRLDLRDYVEMDEDGKILNIIGD